MDISMWVLWIILAVIFIIIEGITLGLTTLWCSVGSLAAALCAYLGASLGIQIAVMVVVSVICFLICLKWIKPQMDKRMNNQSNATNADRVIGETAIVTKTIDTIDGVGLVKVKGQDWSAKSADDSVIKEGAKVKVLSIEGVKLVVEEIKETAI